VSEDDTTLVQWEGHFSARAKSDFVSFEQSSYLSNLHDIREQLLGHPLPIVSHIHEGPTCRVLWLARELGVPLNVREQTPVSEPSLRASSTSLSSDCGGLLSCYEEPTSSGGGSLKLLESGAIVSWLLEKHDARRHLLSPPVGGAARARYLQALFFAVSTMDPLLLEAYREQYVDAVPRAATPPRFAFVPGSSPSALTALGVTPGAGSSPGSSMLASLPMRRLRFAWEAQVCPVLEEWLRESGGPWLCGATFSAADVVCGWSLFLADVLQWLEAAPALRAYLQRLRVRPHFIYAFGLDSTSYF
jgi:glutathione S-transferase